MLEGDVGGEQFVERLVLCERRGEEALAVLVEDGGLRILEEYVGVRVALVELLGNLHREIVVGVLALPETVVEAEDVLQRSVRGDALFTPGIEVGQFLYKQEVTRPGVGVDEAEDGAADGSFLGAAAVADDLIHLGAVGVNGAKVGHGSVFFQMGAEREDAREFFQQRVLAFIGEEPGYHYRCKPFAVFVAKWRNINFPNEAKLSGRNLGFVGCQGTTMAVVAAIQVLGFGDNSFDTAPSDFK